MLVSDRNLLGMVLDWQDLLLSEDEVASERLRLLTRTGRPAGDEIFVETEESLTGRDPRPKKPGKPRK